MELTEHFLILVVLIVYTLLLVLVVTRSGCALKAQHACSDVAMPLARTVTGLLHKREDLFRALGEARFRGVRVVVIGSNGTLFDTHDDAAHDDVREAFASLAPNDSSTKTLMLHRPSGSRLAHVAGVRVSDGTLVVAEA